MSENTITIDIVSDIVCPWCWLGKKHLDAALGDRPELDITIKWRPFMLDHTVPEAGLPYKEYMRKKFGDGPSDRFKSMREHLETASGPSGITFRFDELPMRPNTHKAHRLMKWATGQGKGHDAAEHLFKAYFDELEDIGDVDVLTRLAREIGMDGDLVLKLLTENRDKENVQAELNYFRDLGITGVPTFIYNGQFSVQGGQPASVHAQALDQASQTPTKDVMSLIA